MKKQLMKLLKAKKLIRGRRTPVMPLCIIAVLMVGVAGSLIYHYTIDIDTSGGEVLGDPYWTEFTDMLGNEVTTVPLPDVVQNSYAETDHYLLSLVEPSTRVAMVFTVTGTVNIGVTVEAYLEAGEIDTPWLEGDNYATLMGNGHPDSVELYWRISASYDAGVGPLGDFGFRFVACENPIIPFALSVDPITQGLGAELQDMFGTMQTTIDFGTITPDDLAVINEDYMLYGVDHILVQYAWTGLPTDVHIAVDWSDDLGSTWNVWAPDVDYDLAYAEELLLRFSITADPGSDHSAGLDVGLVLTEGVAPIIPFAMDADVTETDPTSDFQVVDSVGLVTVLTSFDFGTITQGFAKQYTGAALVVLDSGANVLAYTWSGLPTDVSIVLEYSVDGGTNWVVWIAGVNSPVWTDVTVYLRLTITADGTADYPAGLTVSINFAKTN